jgi:hypothetical protein
MGLPISLAQILAWFGQGDFGTLAAAKGGAEEPAEITR